MFNSYYIIDLHYTISSHLNYRLVRYKPTNIKQGVSVLRMFRFSSVVSASGAGSMGPSVVSGSGAGVGPVSSAVQKGIYVYRW